MNLLPQMPGNPNEIMVGVVTTSNREFALYERRYGEPDTIPGDASIILSASIPIKNYDQIKEQVAQACRKATERKTSTSKLVRQLTPVFAEATKQKGDAQ